MEDLDEYYDFDNILRRMLDKVPDSIDKREGSEWFWSVNADGEPCQKPIVEPWKCPYHNGRMCIEIVRRMKQ